MCTRELCVFAFQTLGVMSDAAESVAKDANVSGMAPSHNYVYVRILMM